MQVAFGVFAWVTINSHGRDSGAIQFSGKQLNYLMILASLNTKIRVLRDSDNLKIE